MYGISATRLKGKLKGTRRYGEQGYKTKAEAEKILKKHGWSTTKAYGDYMNPRVYKMKRKK